MQRSHDNNNNNRHEVPSETSWSAHAWCFVAFSLLCFLMIRLRAVARKEISRLAVDRWETERSRTEISPLKFHPVSHAISVAVVMMPFIAVTLSLRHARLRHNARDLKLQSVGSISGCTFRSDNFLPVVDVFCHSPLELIVLCRSVHPSLVLSRFSPCLHCRSICNVSTNR